MNGVLIVDKPQGMSSFDVVRQVRRMCRTRRVGHAGTLDPLATGVLPVAVGWATRLVEYLMEGEKTYQATLRLGIVTDTQDSEGRILEEHAWQDIKRPAMDAALDRFSGEIKQLPPMFSALKKDGKPLYLLARKGVEIERQPRTVHIHQLGINSFNPPYVTITVQCSKGTYIRTLCHDIGRHLGCGAHMSMLRRLACGQFNLSASHSIGALQSMAEQGLPLPLMSPAEVLADWPGLLVTGLALARLRDGVAPALTQFDVSGLVAGDYVRFLAGDDLVAVARYAPGGHGKRPGDFKVLKVFPVVDEDG